jgi:hypothetical protein
VTKTRSPPHRCARICCHAERSTKGTNDRRLMARVTDSLTYNFLASATRPRELESATSGPRHTSRSTSYECCQWKLTTKKVPGTTSGLTTSKMDRKCVLDGMTSASTSIQVSLLRGAGQLYANGSGVRASYVMMVAA